MRRVSVILGILIMSLAVSRVVAGCGCGMASCESGMSANPKPPAADWSSLLILNEAQKLQLDQAFMATGQGMQTLQQKRKDLLSQLQVQIQGNVAERTRVDDLLIQIKDTQQAIQRSHYELWDKIAGFLTPVQCAKFVLASVGRWQGDGPLAMAQPTEKW